MAGEGLSSRVPVTGSVVSCRALGRWFEGRPGSGSGRSEVSGSGESPVLGQLLTRWGAGPEGRGDVAGAGRSGPSDVPICNHTLALVVLPTSQRGVGPPQVAGRHAVAGAVRRSEEGNKTLRNARERCGDNDASRGFWSGSQCPLGWRSRQRVNAAPRERCDDGDAWSLLMAGPSPLPADHPVVAMSANAATA